MQFFKRTVDLTVLIVQYLNSPFLASILRRVGAREFSYLINITFYLPEELGRYDGRPEDCYPTESAEVEFEPMFGLNYLGGKLVSDLQEVCKENCKHFWSYWFIWLLLWVYSDNLVEGFVSYEEEWLETDEAYKLALLEAAKDRHQ